VGSGVQAPHLGLPSGTRGDTHKRKAERGNLLKKACYSLASTRHIRRAQDKGHFMLIFSGKTEHSEMGDGHGLILNTVHALYNVKREVHFAGILFPPRFWNCGRNQY